MCDNLDDVSGDDAVMRHGSMDRMGGGSQASARERIKRCVSRGGVDGGMAV